jgi:hypothetical protein
MPENGQSCCPNNTLLFLIEDLTYTSDIVENGIINKVLQSLFGGEKKSL